MLYRYELFLKHGTIELSRWQALLDSTAKHLGAPARWKIHLLREQNVLRYFLETPRPLPPSFGLAEFFLRETDFELPAYEAKPRRPYFNDAHTNFLTLATRLTKNHQTLDLATLEFYSCHKILFGNTTIIYSSPQNLHCSRKLALFLPAVFLCNNFANSKIFLFKKPPKYLKLDKVTKLFSDSPDSALLEIDTFPYAVDASYLRHDGYDFARHSLILGASGSGKISNSMFIQDCNSLHECIFCSHIANQEHCIANMQFKPDEYFYLKSQIINWILSD